jgi:hypothetical protein
VTKQPRGTQRYHPTQRDDEDALTRAIVLLASQYGRYGYRRITVSLREAGWRVGKDRVERIWHREGAEGSPETEATWPVVAQRRVERTAAAGAAQSRLVVRFRQHLYARWQDGADAEPDR